ncbi:MAG: G5 domain-containing protein, partial [Oscillospiraceae bacterium]|nr:G5 domain-containing protein [Oscillospiraceae bacterium]
MKPQIVNAKMNKLLFRGKMIKISIFAAIVFSVVMMTGYRSFTTSVFITDTGATREIKTNESDIYEILRSENYKLDAEDRVSYTKDENNEGHITIHRAFTVYVNADGETHKITTVGGTVEDILKKAGVKLRESDAINAAINDEVIANMEITVTRIRHAERTAEEEIPFGIKYIDDPNSNSGTEKLISAGINGSRTITYKDTYVDGKLMSSVKIAEEVTKQPVSQVTKRGIALASPYNSNTPDSVKLVNGIPENYTRVLSGKATAYYAPAGSLTASGRKAVIGTVAVNPNVIPYGSELYIVSTDGLVYGYAIAADTGGGMMSGHALVDLFMANYSDCCQWGVHTVNVYV